MYGTIARMRLKPGAEQYFRAQLEALVDLKINGWMSSTLYRSDDDPLDIWMAVIFESREAYRQNAESTNQHARWQRMRECLESDPEWFDGEVLVRVARSAAD